MAYINWQDTFSTNIELIDNQHKTLITMINRLERANAGGTAEDEIAKIITELVQYTRKHFADEEQHMRQIKFAGYERHQQLHRELISQIVDILQRLKAGREVGAFELLSFLKDWLINHILKEDRKIGRAVVANAPRSG